MLPQFVTPQWPANITPALQKRKLPGLLCVAKEHCPSSLTMPSGSRNLMLLSQQGVFWIVRLLPSQTPSFQAGHFQILSCWRRLCPLPQRLAHSLLLLCSTVCLQGSLMLMWVRHWLHAVLLRPCGWLAGPRCQSFWLLVTLMLPAAGSSTRHRRALHLLLTVMFVLACLSTISAQSSWMLRACPSPCSSTQPYVRRPSLQPWLTWFEVVAPASIATLLPQ